MAPAVAELPKGVGFWWQLRGVTGLGFWWQLHGVTRLDGVWSSGSCPCPWQDP